jgi:serine-type D-Ala-D-Ala carboxypeptidase/endopeptidase (penicillin-binding protein 4)
VRASSSPRRPGALVRGPLALLVALAVIAGACSSPVEPEDAPEAAPEPPVSAPRDPTSVETLEPDGPPLADLPEDPPEPLTPPANEPPPPPATRDGLTAVLRRLTAGAVEQSGSGTIAVLVVDEHGRELVSHAPDEPVMPASTLKIVTAAAALTTFGADGTFTTSIEATAPIDGDGVLRGDLLLVGGGDPVLATDEYRRWVYPARPQTPLESLADDLVTAGLRRVDGDVIGVVDGYSGPRVATGWPERYFWDFDARYHDGLTVDAGLRTIVRFPEPDEDDLEGAATDGAADEAPDAPPPAPTVLIDHTPDPALHATTELVRVLQERGVEVVGGPTTEPPTAPSVGRLARIESPPLVDLLRFAVQRSDNQVTDGLFRAVGRARTGEGSFEAGDRALRQVLERFSIATDGLHFADGSGLSRDDRMTVRALVDLDRAMQRSRHAPTWTSLMAVMGESGTLDARLRGTAAQGRFAGKTGTLQDVTGLVGTVHGPGAGRYHLGVIANDAGAARWMARTLADELVLALVGDLDRCAVTFVGDEPGTLGVPPIGTRC